MAEEPWDNQSTIPSAGRITNSRWSGGGPSRNLRRAHLLMRRIPGTLSTGVFRMVNGVEAVPVISAGPENETVFVALTGEPYPVRVATGTGRGAVDFLDYGDPVAITAPPRAEVAEFPALPGG